ncbi:MAG: ribonuclease HI family protein [Gemmatimonadota bacterium]|nr:ribonuclease HI family protein [Gemmatimonadota bacterium]
MDGAARGNPGPAGAGWVVETPEGTVVEDGCAYLGERTNNQAEYEALIRALEAVDPDSETTLTVYSDSELLVRQLNGEYRVKNPGLLERHRRATRRLSRAAGWTIRHVDREENRDADALANQAIDAYALEGEASGEA